MHQDGLAEAAFFDDWRGNRKMAQAGHGYLASFVLVDAAPYECVLQESLY
jgi:hypothetical protein